MRVTLVGDHPPPYGGISIHVEQLHRFLQRQGFAVQVLDIGKGNTPSPGVLPVRSWGSFARHAQRLFSSEDLVHAHVSGNNPKAWAVAAALSMGRGPRVLTVHSGLFPAFAARSMRNRLLVRGAASSFQRVVAVSAAVQEALIRCGVPKNQLLQLPAFLGSEMVPGDPPVSFAEVRRRRNPLLVYAHHPSPVYGRAVAFLALRQLSRAYPEIGLLVVGPGTHSPDFWRDARIYGVEGLIENAGEIPQGSFLAALAQSDVFIRPTTADGDSLSVREALALGIPTVASNVSARPEGTVIFSAGNPRSLSDAVVQSLSDRPFFRRIWDCGPRLLELYRELMSQKEGTTRAASK